jgi:predicted RNA polymerase sigma factor
MPASPMKFLRTRIAQHVWYQCSKLSTIFNEGYSATAGEDWMPPELCEDELRLGRTLAELLPEEPEVHGLVSLMEIQAFVRELASARPASRFFCLIRTARCGANS